MPHWVISPSTQTVPRRSRYCLSLPERSATGHGASRVAGASVMRPLKPLAQVEPRRMGTVTSLTDAPRIGLGMPRVPGVRGRLKDIPVPGHKRVLLAAPRGYCAGVDRAVIAVEKALEHYGAPVYVRKQIVHNIHVVTQLEAQGAIFVEEVDEVPEGAHVVFSAHGVSPAVVAAASDRRLQAIDATCPLVTKVHREAVRFARDDFEILLIGHEGHEKGEGTAGEAPDHVTIVNSPAHADTIEVRDPSRVVWLSQTTLSVDETMDTVRRLRARFPQLQDPPSDDICYATQNRQVAIKKVAKGADLVIVVGSANSSNSVRLVEVALEYGAKAAYRIDYADEMRQEWFDGVETVGVTSGASVPEVLVAQVLEELAGAGYRDVEEVKTAEEDLIFSLPKELRQDAAGNRDERALGGRVQ